jgi:hypothetical protein
MASRRLPILLPCHGTSARGVPAESVADELVERGLVEVVVDIEAVVAQARGGRQVLAMLPARACASATRASLP